MVHLNEPNKMSEYLLLTNANVRWYLSLDNKDLPKSISVKSHTTFRSILIDGKELEFTNGFTDLHTRVYKYRLNGKGFCIRDARTAIEIVYTIMNAEINENCNYVHPFLKRRRISKLESLGVDSKYL